MAIVQAMALRPIIENGKTVKYKLKDENGLIMDIPCNSIIAAIQAKKIEISNLKIVNGTELQMVQPEKEQIKETKHEEHKKQPIKQTEPTQTSAPTSTSTNSDIARMKEILPKINEARKVYEQGTDEIMTNYEYDKLCDELTKLENKTGVILKDSPSITVGYEVVSSLQKQKHPRPMLSLEKTKDREALRDFLGNEEGVLSWKLDGLTVVVTYNNGVLESAVTRGNGEIGEVVTNNAKHFKNLPRRIALKGRTELRGEATISYSKFNQINSKISVTDEKYKNPRNLCSGTVRQLDSKVVAERDVEWRCFEIVSCEKSNMGNLVDKQFDFLSTIGIEPVEYVVVNKDNILEAIDYFEKKLQSGKMDIPTDGLVLTFRNRQYGLSLGTTAKSPRHSLAFKWKDETAVTKLIDIEWSASRNGLVTPVAIFEPVDIEGSTVGRATLHNFSILKQVLGQPYVGQEITVYKANMIIPNVESGVLLESLPSSKTQSVQLINISTTTNRIKCPDCGEELTVHREIGSGVETLWCENEFCPKKGTRSFEHFVARDAMNIEGISIKTIEVLMDAGILTDFVSIYHLDEHRNEIINMDGFGKVSYYKMIQAIEKSRNVKPANLLFAVGIPNVGLSTAKTICKAFDNDIVKAVSARYCDYVAIDGIGDIIADSIIDYFSDRNRAVQFVELYQELNVIQEKVSTDTSMKGVVVCITGTLDKFPNRDTAKNIVENMGGKLTGSVSSKTSYLVTNNTASGSKKNKDAVKYGVPILTEQEFIDKFNINI